MKTDPRTKLVRNLWTNPAIIFDHEEIERSYAEYLDRTLQRYDSKRAALGVLRSQRNVFGFLSRGGLLKQALAPENINDLPSPSTTPGNSSVSNSSSTSSDTPSKIEGRPVRSCTLTTPKAKKDVIPVAAAVSKKKPARKKSPLRGKSSSSSSAPAAKRINPKSASFKYNSDSSSSSLSTSGASESATVYQQQLVIKRLEKSMEELVKRSEESEKKRLAEKAESEKTERKHLAQITTLTSVADEYKKFLASDNSSSSILSNNNKRKSRISIPIYLNLINFSILFCDTGKNMETVGFSPATVIPHSYDIDSPSTLLVANQQKGATSSSIPTSSSDNGEDLTENAFMNEVMRHYRHCAVQRENAIFQKENAELSKKLEELTFQMDMAGIFAKYNRK